MGHTVTFDDLLDVYLRRNPERSVQAVKNDLIAEANKAHQSGDEQRMAQADFLLLQIQEYEQKQQANTPPPKQKPYARQTNSASQAPSQANTAQTYPSDYNIQKAVFEIIAGASAITVAGCGLFLLGSLCVNAAKGIANGIANSIELAVPYVLGAISCGLALIAAKEFFTTKETPTVPNGTTGYTINHYHYGNGRVTTEQK